VNDDLEKETDNNTGRIPLNISCELHENIINTCISGDTVIVNGILKAEYSDDSK
jgi:DNA replicative helicase MCM subunit Mcm2 (Cdc46/Mcm family)